MAIHWRCRFKSLNGTDYSVNIYDSTYTTGDPVELTGAAVPVTTQEPADHDPLAPLRLSTGTLNLINTGNLDALIPSTPKARPVTITTGSAVVWQGYIQQQQFTQPWLSTPYQLSFPLVSAFGILEGVQLVKDELQPRTRIAEYLRQAILKTGHTFQTIVFPDNFQMSSDDTRVDTLLRLGIQERNWFTYRNENIIDPDQARWEGASWLEIISAIMEAFGLTLYEQGQTLYLMARVNTSYYQMPFSALATLAANGTPASGVETEAAQGLVSINNLPLGGSDGTVDILTVARNGVIEANINEFGDDATPQFDMVYMDYVATLAVSKQAEHTQGFYYFSKTLGVYEPEQQQEVWTLRSFQSGQQVTYSAQDITQGNHMAAFCRRKSGEDVLLINYSDVGSSTAYGGTWTCSLKSAAQTMFAGGYLVLQGYIEFHQGEGEALLSTYKAKFSLRVGDKWYNLSTNTWQASEVVMSVSIDPDTGQITSVGASSVNVGDDDKLYIPVPDTGLFGDVELRVYDPESSAAAQTVLEAMFVFKDLALDYTGPLQDKYKDYPVTDTNRFVEIMNEFATEDAEKNIQLTSYVHERMGYAVLLKPDFSAPLGKVYERSELEYFEEGLLYAIHQCNYRPQQILRIPVRQDGQFSPLNLYSSHRYLSSETDWRNSLQKLQIFKQK